MYRKKNVVVGLSGGVDSAVAALILKEQGFNVIGAFMKNFSDKKNKLTGECNWIKDKIMAQKVAAHLNIPFVMFDFEEEYRKSVIDKMFRDYSKGLTPNPDSLCNAMIKFPLFWKEAKKLKADYIAMGHYIIRKKRNKVFILCMPKDMNKDQSYFLYGLSQKDLRHTLFPIGDFTKEEIREIARKNGFPNYNRKGTVGICFIGKVDMQEFLKRKITPKKGNLLSPEGEIVGTHPGSQFFTYGQRVGESHGFNIDKKYRNLTRSKLYIADKNSNKNTITIAPEGHPALLKRTFKIIRFNLINKDIKIPKLCKVRIRHLGPLMKASIEKKGNSLLCILSKPIIGLAQGQSAVLYKGKEMLGGGEIRF